MSKRKKHDDPPSVQFDLTPGQWKKLSEIVRAANAARYGGWNFCVVAQVDLLPWSGPFTKARVRARLANKEQFHTVARALRRAGMTTKPEP